MATDTPGKAQGVEAAATLESRLADYPKQLRGYDEMWDATPAGVQAHWRRLMRDLTELGGDELERRRLEARRLLRENGVTYNIYNDPKGQQRTWQLDPVPLVLKSADWAVISAGLKQRARLLDMVYRDLYGERHLIKEGLLPPELVFAHQGFLRPCDQVPKEDMPQLLLYATDLARGPDGRMWVLGDRTQAPSGAGYALESRMAMTRVMADEFRRTQVHRLSLFFRNLRATLAGLLPNAKEEPRVVILTPGPRNETYFEHAYLASYLGFNLVQGDDLTVRDGKVWLKSLEGLKQVDIIVRRVDDTFCDPLELREDSHLGVPGLLQAARLGNVIIANPLGASVLENPGIMPFLPSICRHWLGEEIMLPSAATWWCGQKKERDHVLANLPKLVIKGIDRRAPSIFASQLKPAELEQLKQRILAAPYLYVGQEVLSCSTAPSLAAGDIVPRRVLLRAFLTAHQGDYDVMPGGLTRVAPDADSLFISNQAGGLSKDTWILADKPVHQVSLWPTARPGDLVMLGEGALPSRSGENLYWVGRYAERAEGTLRLLRTAIAKLADYDDYGDDADLAVLRQMLATLTHLTGMYPGFTGEDADKQLANPRPRILEMALNRSQRSSLIGTLDSFMQSAFNVRDLWSVDTWRVVDTIDSTIQHLAGSPDDFGRLQNELDSLIGSLMAFFGQTQESMPHESGWYMLTLGRRLERGLQLVNILRNSLVHPQADVVEHLTLEAVLLNQASLNTHRRRYRALQQVMTVLDLLLLDAQHPRSLAYQVEQISQKLAKLPPLTKSLGSHQLSREQRLILQVSTDLKLAEAEKLSRLTEDTNTRIHLDKLLNNVERRLSKISALLTEKYFSHTQSARQLAPTRIELSV